MKNKIKSFLENILVLDLADEQGSFCSKLLADLGATVLKIERTKGDESRRKAPVYRLKSGARERSLFFFYHNANKKILCFDWKTSAGKLTLNRLLEKSDVLIETLSPQQLKNIGLERKYLHGINPRLIHISITGFGRSGPRRNYRSCDGIVSALGGQMYTSGTPLSPPLKLFGQQSYYAASLFGAVAVLLSLRKRKITGKGCTIDLSSQEALVSTLDHVLVDYFYNKRIAKRQGTVCHNKLFSILPCKDGHIQITILQNWETLLELMASEGKAEDLLEKKWLRGAYREKRFDHVVEVVKGWASSHTRNELFELGQAMRFPWAPLTFFSEVLKSPQLEARSFFKHSSLPGGGSSIPFPGLPYKFSSISSHPLKSVPLLGAQIRHCHEEPAIIQEKSKVISRNERGLNPSTGNENILDGLRVLDFTRLLAGPYATRIFADFGAEVIKVQSKMTARGAEQNDTAYFSTWNRNKRSISLNLEHPEARSILLQLVVLSDVVVENFSSRVMSNWGLSYERLTELKPDLVMLSISAMGHTGPWKDFVGFSPTLHALSGLTSATSRHLDSPVCLGHAYGDIITGLYAALAILAAVEHRDKTGDGQHIDLSEYEALCTLLGPYLMKAALEPKQGESSQRCVDLHEAAPCGCYQCKGDDRWCVITVFNQDDWQAFCRVSGQPELMADKFSTIAKRRKNRTELDKLISQWTAGHAAEAIERKLQAADVAAAVVQNAADLAADIQLAARRFFISLQHPLLGKTFSDRSALWPWRQQPKNWKAAPLLGEDNRHVFVELLGMTDADLLSFMKRGIIS